MAEDGGGWWGWGLVEELFFPQKRLMNKVVNNLQSPVSVTYDLTAIKVHQ